MYFIFSMTIFSFEEFILQKLNAKASIHTVDCGNEISSSWSKYAKSVCTQIEAIPSSISIAFMGFERVYRGTSHNVPIRGIGQLPAKQVYCSEMLQCIEHHKQQCNESLEKAVLCWRWCLFLLQLSSEGHLFSVLEIRILRRSFIKLCTPGMKWDIFGYWESQKILYPAICASHFIIPFSHSEQRTEIRCSQFHKTFISFLWW